MDKNIQTLQAIFPQIPTEIIQNVLSITSGNLDQASAILQNALEQQEEGSDEEEKNTNSIADKRSVISPHGFYNSECGYCKQNNSSASFGSKSSKLSVADYQEMIDRGWRRSGTWLYKPTLDKTCCPQYTIRLDVDKFKPSRKHKRVQKNLQQFIQKDIRSAEITEEDEMEDDSSIKPSKEEQTPKDTNVNKKQEIEEETDLQKTLKDILFNAIKKSIDSNAIPSDVKITKDMIVLKKQQNRKTGDFSSNIAIVINGYLKKNFPKPKKGEKTETTSNHVPLPVDIANAIFSHLSPSLSIGETKIKGEVATNGYINFFIEGENLKMEETPTPSSAKPFQKKAKKETKDDKKEEKVENMHKLEIEMVPSSFSQEEYSIYFKYQTTIHKDKPSDVSEKGYTRFLVTSPLEYVKDETLPCGGYGSFHQKYRLDGKLIAVGVVDVLPKCLSSVYFFYDPDYSFLSLGVYSALQEIEWVKNTSNVAKELHYYYLGFYIHNCAKMKYKAQYKPSDLLCPITFKWTLLSDAVPKLNVSKFSQLVQGVSDLPSGDQKEQALENIPILYKSKVIKLKDLTPSGKKVMRPKLEEWLNLVGVNLSSRILYEV